jgi:HEAT repeat protein
LPRLTNAATVILVGKVIGFQLANEQSTKSGNSYQVNVQVNRVLKGSVRRSPIVIKFVKPADGASVARNITPSLYGMFFLNQESPNIYSLADRNVQAVVAADGPPSSSRDLLDQVVNEVGLVLVTPDSPSGDQLQAILAIKSVDSPAATEALQQALQSKDASVKLEAQAGLLKRNDISVLDQVQDRLLKSPSDFSDAAVLALSNGIRDGIRDPQAIPLLARLLTAGNLRVRRAAAHALRETHTNAAIGALSVALSDSDQMVRYDAVLGLAEIKGDFSHAPSLDTFKGDENKYLSYWRDQVK